MDSAEQLILVPPEHLVAIFTLDGDPFSEPSPEELQLARPRQVATKAQLLFWLARGWVQFQWNKVTEDSESSIIATRNRNLYTYSFKGGKAPRKAGLFTMVAFGRASAGGKPAWRSAYARTVTQVDVVNKNQGRGRATKNTKVDVNTGSRQTIDWDYFLHRPIR